LRHKVFLIFDHLNNLPLSIFESIDSTLLCLLPSLGLQILFNSQAKVCNLRVVSLSASTDNAKEQVFTMSKKLPTGPKHRMGGA